MKKFIIYGIDTIDGAPGGLSYTLQLNPESIKRNRAITMGEKAAVDTAQPVVQYLGYGEETMDLDFYLDSTGAVLAGGPMGTKDVSSVDEELASLEATIYTFDGSLHKPKYLFVEYGDFNFRCMMTAFNIEFLLFDLDGAALRAKVHLSLKGYQQETSKKSSPDMSHSFTIREGDSLPLLCKQVYGDMNYYLQVAEHNGLTNFRELEVGSTIELPPLQR
jgi:nucleoid-associated protein YgaU